MKLETKPYRVTINGEWYDLVTDETVEHVTAAATLVNEYMSTIIKAAPSLDEKNVAVLAALRMASEKIHIQCGLENAQRKEAQMIDDVNNLLNLA